MDHFLSSFKSVRETPNLVPSSNKGFHEELHQTAKDLVRTNQHKYSVLPIYEIILNDLKKGKTIQDIKEGFFSTSNYPFCLCLDRYKPEFQQIRVSYTIELL